MIATPPFYLSGQGGKALGAEGYSFEILGVQSAELLIRTLDVDELHFTIHAKDGRIIPDDDQWITLKDDAGKTHFTGLAKRTFSYADRLYSYTVANVYKGMMETPLLDNGRAFVTYPQQELGTRLLAILNQAVAAGLPILAPETMPEFLIVPKQAFRAQSIAAALEDALKWAPDCVTRMDYSTTPPTLRFFTRTAENPTVIDLDADGNHVSSIKLTPYPEARALAVSFVYARRDGDSGVVYLIQTAGDDNAEAHRKISLYLSGAERSDMLVSEALSKAQAALLKIDEVIVATSAAVEANAATALITITWIDLVELDSNLQTFVATYPGFSMYPGAGSITLYTGITWGGGSYTGTETTPINAVALRTAAGAAATGWYPIKSGSFSDADLALAGAIKESRYITGHMLAVRPTSSESALFAVRDAGGQLFSGYTSGSASSAADADTKYRQYVKYLINIQVDAINMAPSAVAAAIKLALEGTETFIDRAEFVDAPLDLAANYFARQNWTPYKGTMQFNPAAEVTPEPGDFVSVRGPDVPAEWADMKAPVAEQSVDLSTLESSVTLGPSPRMNYTSLIDRLRIPPEDNYEAG